MLRNLVALHVRGMILLKQGLLDEAVHIFERGIRENPRRIHQKYFRSALAMARIRLREFDKAAEEVSEQRTVMSNVVQLHAYGALGDIERAKEALNRLQENRRPKVVRLRDALAQRFISPMVGQPQPSDEEIFEQECELLLVT